MFQCIEVIGIPDITEIKNDERYTINIYFASVWSIGSMKSNQIVNLANGGIRIEFHK